MSEAEPLPYLIDVVAGSLRLPYDMGMSKSQSHRAAVVLGSCSLALILAACQTATPPPPDPPAFVEAACGGCHAVEPPFLSPNPQAPSFAAIANREGLSRDTLAGWLADAHNYPEMMDFDLEREQVSQIAEYMATLRRDDYTPAP